MNTYKRILSIVLSGCLFINFLVFNCFGSAPRQKNKKLALPIDFTNLEEVDFYGGVGPIKPDRVYLDERGDRVAYFSREKCFQLQQLLKDSAEKYYIDNRALLFGAGSIIRERINSTSDHSISFFSITSTKSYLRSLLGAAGLYNIVTALLMINEPNCKNIVDNMRSLQINCMFCNDICAGKDPLSGLEVGFDFDSERFALPYKRLSSDTLMNSILERFLELNSLDDIIGALKYIESIFRNANQSDDTILKNSASVALTKVSKIFHENFERQIRFVNLTQDDIPLSNLQEIARVLAVRRYINHLVLAYRWMSIQINVLNSGNLNVLYIASPSGISRSYLSNTDATTLAENIALRVTTEVNRFLNRCLIQEATFEFIEEALEKSGIDISQLTDKKTELENQLDELQEEILSDVVTTSTELESSAVNGLIKNNLSLCPACFSSILDTSTKTIEDFIKILCKIKKIDSVSSELEDITNQLLRLNLFRETVFLHCQLQYVLKYFPDFSGIIITERTISDTKKIYDIEFFH